MILNLKENRSARYALVATIVFTVFLTWLYLAGGIFLGIIGLDYNKATPLTAIQYAWYFSDNAWIATRLAGSLGLSAVFLGIPAALLFRKQTPSLHGDARFATSAEIKRAGLLDSSGILVGSYKGKYLMFPGSQHVMVAAPTRSGKGVSIVIPNLLQWPESCVVLDIKQENWEITSGYRKKYGQQCFLFNPAATDGRTHRYNPLGYISSDPGKRIDDVQKIAHMLFPDMPNVDPIWTATPRALFLGIVLYLAETPGKPCTIGQVLRESLNNGDASEYFSKIIEARQKSGTPLSGACERALSTYCSISAANTRGGVISSFRSRLELWMNPVLDAATSDNDFNLADLRKKRMSIYIGVTPDNLERMAPLINLFFQQIIDINTRELPERNSALKYKCLLILDEFTSIGKIGVLAKGIAFIAGYGLRMMPIIQNPAQLAEVYGRENAATFQQNHALQVIFPPKPSETQTAKDISEWLGYTTVKSASRSRSTELFRSANRSESVSEQRRALLLPQEITALDQDTEIIALENLRPIKAQKARYFVDAKFMDRLKEISPSLRDFGRRMPSKKALDQAISRKELSAPVPMLDIASHISELERQKALSSTPSTIRRNFSAMDMPKLRDVKFSIDFSDIPSPPPESTQEHIEAWVKKLAERMEFDIDL